MPKPATILVVEDEPPLLDMLTMLLEDEGYLVQTANNGREGLTRLHESRPDLVLSDLMMPELDGRSLCAAIRADPALTTTPVVLMSAASLGSTPKNMCDAFVAKPFAIQDLLRVIEALLPPRAEDDAVLVPA